jgi:molecular chaperone GrpE (heat shock protein)
MSNSTTTSDEFAAAMQQLSAEAKKISPVASPSARLTSTGPALETRLQELEAAITRKIDDAVNAVSRARTSDLAIHFRHIEEHLAAIRNSETVNQKLFDSLHDELLKYRDNFVHESLQKPFIHDLIHLFDDLTSLASQIANSTQDQKQRPHLTQWSENLENAIHSLVEILHRFDVQEVEPMETVDRAAHKVVSYEPADYAEEDGRIVMRLKRGFLWRGNLIRPEEVIAKRYG